MPKIAWDKTGDRKYETGADHGVLYIPDAAGNYKGGVPWNGLTTVTETPAGAESNPQYADNIKYLNLLSAETFGGTIEAFTYPDEFGQCDGTVEPTPGLSIGQQSRAHFGFSYRTKIGNDTEGQDHGYKLHLIYGALASPSEKAMATVNDSPEAVSLSWQFDTDPVQVTRISGLKATALITVDSTKVSALALAQLEDILYGTDTLEPRLPLPDEVIDILGGNPVLGTLTVNSVAGSTTGHTTVTVTEAVASGNQRRYKVAASVVLPAYGDVVAIGDGWTAFPSNGDIEAPNGQQIVVVDATISGAAARAAGKTTVVSAS